MSSRQALLLGRPGWRLPYNPSLDIDFSKGRAWVSNRAYMGDGAIRGLFGTWSTPAHYATGTSGLLYSVAANTLDFLTCGQDCQGQLIEEARTNVALWCRDLTNAAWTKSNTTAAKDQTGPDGVANSASSLTATSGNGTVLQAITLGSSARWQTAYVKRITGTGTVNMTMDNGSTWTAITVTAGWTRVAIPTQTLANPTVGFQIVTSGDAIAIDFVQNEASGSFATSPIATTTASVARAASNIIRTLSTEYNSTNGTWLGEFLLPTPVSGARIFASTADGSTQLQLANASTVGTYNGSVAKSGGAGQSLSLKTRAINGYNASGRSVGWTGGSIASDANLNTTLTATRFGSANSATNYLDGYLSRAALYPVDLSSGQKTALITI